VVVPQFLLPLGIAVMNDSDVVIDTHANANANAHKNTNTNTNTHTQRENKIQNDVVIYEGWNFNSGNYLFTTDTK